jgi:hypothetical protein
MYTELTVNETAAQRISRHDEAALQAGFAPSTPLFAIGTRLALVGQEAYRQSRATYEQRPEAGEALPLLIQQIEAECRIDLDVRPQQLEMQADGTLTIVRHPLFAGQPLFFTGNAFKQFARWITDPRHIPNPGAYLAAIEPERRARIVNEELARSEKAFKLRTRTPNGHSEVFAVTSTRYTPADVHLVAQALLGQIDPRTRTDIVYQGTKAKIDFVYHSPVEAIEAAVGDYYKAAQSFRTNDDGTSAVRGASHLYRALCVNLTTVRLAQDVLHRRHIGDLGQILAAVGQGLDQSHEHLKFFLEAWGVAQTLEVPALIKSRTGRTFTADTPKPVFEALFNREHKAWTVPGVSPEAIAQAAEEAWFAEPADWSVVGLSNALSRAAHQGAWADLDTEELLQARAGQLVTAGAKAPWDFTVHAEI